MSTVFQDTFTGSDTTALTSHTPDVGTSWTKGSGSTSAILSNANRARTSATGAKNHNFANPASALSTHDHTVQVKIRWMGSGGAGGSAFYVFSHGGGDGVTGPTAGPATGYYLRVNLETGNVVGGRNAIAQGTFPSGVAELKVASGTLATGDEFMLYLITATSGGNCTVSFKLQRLSNNDYLQSNGTWAATASDLRVEGLYSDSSPLAVAPAGIGWFEYAGNSTGIHADDFLIDVPTSSSFAVAGPNSAAALPSNHGGNITLTLTGTGTSWTGGGTTFAASGVSGWAKVSQNVVSGTSATVVVSCPTAASPPAGATGTLTVSDGALTATIAVNTPTLSSSPTHSAAGGTPTLTMTGANTLWQSETAAGLFTVSGGTGPSFATPTVTTNTSATDVLTVGTSAGTLTLTDASTGATFSFTADAPAALTAGTPIQVCTAAAVTIYCDGTNGSTAESGGLAPYSYQWYVSSTNPNFTPGAGTIIGGATSQNLSVSSPGTTLKFYKQIVTDSQGTPATATTVEAPGRLLDVAVKVGFVGDSLYFNTPSGGSPPPTNFSSYAAYIGGRLHAVTVSNQAISGTKTADWVSGSADLIAAKVAFASAGVTHVFVRLGANDANASVSAATYLTNLTSCVNDLVAAGYTVILNYPTFGRPGGSYGGAKNKSMFDYQAQIDSLVNGTTIFAGDKKQWDASAVITGWRTDDVHPTAEGSRELALADLLALAGVLYPAAGGLLHRGGMTGGTHKS